MSNQEEIRKKYFTDFDGAFDGRLARVVPIAANYTSEWAGSAARYDCRIKIRYNKELIAQLEEGMHVLDVGCGVGGASRTLAGEFGCLVTGLDLTETYIRAAEMLTNLVGLGDRVTFHQGSALEISFEDESFDAAWLQHVSMNIEDKKRLFGGIQRIIRSGGRLAIHEIMEGPASNARYPVFWASNESISFLEPPDEIRELLTETGFSELEWNDVTERALELTRKRHDEAAKVGPNPLGLNVIVPKDVPQKVANSLKNLEEGRIIVVQAVFDRIR